MMRFAQAGDLVRLKGQYPDGWLMDADMYHNWFRNPNWHFEEMYRWGLKQMGHLFCYDQILSRNAKTILEAGAGFNLYFERMLTSEYDYWTMDKKGFYKDNLLQRANKLRMGPFVDALLGEHSPDLPNDHFDMVMSISVLEHVDAQDIPRICTDMYRVLAPGGAAVHSIDCLGGVAPEMGDTWYKNLLEAGFVIEGEPDFRWIIHPAGGRHTLSEPLQIVFNNYYGQTRDKWTHPVMPAGPYGTILVVAEKPAA